MDADRDVEGIPLSMSWENIPFIEPDDIQPIMKLLSVFSWSKEQKKTNNRPADN